MSLLLTHTVLTYLLNVSAETVRQYRSMRLGGRNESAVDAHCIQLIDVQQHVGTEFHNVS